MGWGWRLPVVGLEGAGSCLGPGAPRGGAATASRGVPPVPCPHHLHRPQASGLWLCGKMSTTGAPTGKERRGEGYRQKELTSPGALAPRALGRESQKSTPWRCLWPTHPRLYSSWGPRGGRETLNSSGSEEQASDAEHTARKGAKPSPGQLLSPSTVSCRQQDKRGPRKFLQTVRAWAPQ